LGWLDLPDSATAHREALTIAEAYRAAMIAEGEDPADCLIEISDEHHRVIQQVPL
jgi:hypothetical protein